MLATHEGQVQDPDQQPAEQQLVPTVLQWSQGGLSVYVTGSFNHWGERIPLRRSGAEFVVCLNLIPGTYQFKFIVDNEWRYATDQHTVRDQMGNINNCITVEDQAIYLHEDPASGFFCNANNAYSQRLPDEITLAKEPPQAPLHLSVLPQNLQSALEERIASWTMLPPLSVTLTHMVKQKSADGATVMACTYRFRTKFVTIIVHKPTAGAVVAQQRDAQQVLAVATEPQPPKPAPLEHQQALFMQQQVAAMVAQQRQWQFQLQQLRLQHQTQHQHQIIAAQQEQQLLQQQALYHAHIGSHQQHHQLHQHQHQHHQNHNQNDQQQQHQHDQQRQKQRQQQRVAHLDQAEHRSPPERGISRLNVQAPAAVIARESDSMPPPPPPVRLPVSDHCSSEQACPATTTTAPWLTRLSHRLENSSTTGGSCRGDSSGGDGENVRCHGEMAIDLPQAMDLSSRPGSQQAFMDALPVGDEACPPYVIPTPSFGQSVNPDHSSMDLHRPQSLVFTQSSVDHVLSSGPVPPVFNVGCERTAAGLAVVPTFFPGQGEPRSFQRDAMTGVPSGQAPSGAVSVPSSGAAGSMHSQGWEDNPH